MTRWVVAGFLAMALTVLAVTAVLGHRPHDGPVVVSLSTHHGLHRTDFLVGALWLTGLACCGWLLRRP